MEELIPMTLKRKGDFLFGRGVEDDQHGIVSSYFAVKALQEEGVRPAYPIGLIWVSDEETGSPKGLQYVLKKKRNLFKAEDLIIVPDAGNREGTMIEVAEKSMLWMKFTLLGKQCHGSRPDIGNKYPARDGPFNHGPGKTASIFSKKRTPALISP